MPCYEVNTMCLEFKAQNKSLMMDVLKEMNLNPRELSNGNISCRIGTFDFLTGKIEIEDRRLPTLNEFKRNYSKKILSFAAKKFGWAMKEKKVKGKSVFEAVKW